MQLFFQFLQNLLHSSEEGGPHGASGAHPPSGPHEAPPLATQEDLPLEASSDHVTQRPPIPSHKVLSRLVSS